MAIRVLKAASNRPGAFCAVFAYLAPGSVSRAGLPFLCESGAGA